MHAGRDGLPCLALLLKKKGTSRYVSNGTKRYCKSNSGCRWDLLFEYMRDITILVLSLRVHAMIFVSAIVVAKVVV